MLNTLCCVQAKSLWQTTTMAKLYLARLHSYACVVGLRAGQPSSTYTRPTASGQPPTGRAHLFLVQIRL